MLFATYLTISNAAGSGLQIEQRTESAADLQTRSPQLLNRLKLTYQLLHNRRPAPLRSQRIEPTIEAKSVQCNHHAQKENSV